ncbi:hypothetical protein NS506_02757 [Nocardia seriolae]|uniref:Uncharacterized protein n=1 Tax=Nocardia seriolae TaxID=37332 RepID=A0ABC8ARU1_9NOCA|nr:hypothetical protein NS506_02757 [Nocardia seriolae]
MSPDLCSYPKTHDLVPRYQLPDPPAGMEWVLTSYGWELFTAIPPQTPDTITPGSGQPGAGAPNPQVPPVPGTDEPEKAPHGPGSNPRKSRATSPLLPVRTALSLAEANRHRRSAAEATDCRRHSGTTGGEAAPPLRTDQQGVVSDGVRRTGSESAWRTVEPGPVPSTDRATTLPRDQAARELDPPGAAAILTHRAGDEHPARPGTLALHGLRPPRDHPTCVQRLRTDTAMNNYAIGILRRPGPGRVAQ